MIVTSPNHEGVDGMDCEKVWMWIAESAIVLMCYPYQGDSQCLPDRKANSGALYLSPMISLRNSWVKETRNMLSRPRSCWWYSECSPLVSIWPFSGKIASCQTEV